MKITLFQFDLKWLDKKSNLSTVQLAIENNPTTDLLVLPEMFNTAYIMNPIEGAEVLRDSYTIREIQAMLQNSSMIVAGSIPSLLDGKFYNSFVFISKDGLLFQYDKIHLFKMAGEGKAYSAGHNSTIFQYLGFNIRPLICYDLRFPYLSFQQKINPHDILIYSANWPVRRIQHWRLLLQARAIENQCYVIGVNRLGFDQNDLSYNGNSLAVDYSGKIISDLQDMDIYSTIDIDYSAMEEFRVKLPFLNDALL